MERDLHVSGREATRPALFNRLRSSNPSSASIRVEAEPGKKFRKNLQPSYRNAPMPGILIVDGDDLFLKALEDYFEASSCDLGLFPAKNGKQAIRIIENEPVDLVVTDLMMPEMDGFELLAYLNDHFPSTPVIVVSTYETPETKEKLQRLGSFPFIKKPLQFKELEDAILYSLQQEHGKGSISGVSIASFIQMVDSDQKTCLVEARTEISKPGYLYFNKGELWDAMWGALTGKEAAIEIIGWERAEILFKNLPKKKIRKRIESGLMSLIMAAMKHRDEKSSFRQKPVVAVETAPAVTDRDQKPDSAFEDSETFYSLERIERESEGKRRQEQAEEEIRIVETTDPFSKALGEFLEISGVEAVMLVEKDGSVLESSVSSGDIDRTKVGVSVAMVLQGAERMGIELAISAFQHLMLESAGAAIVCAPVGDVFLVLVARDSQRLGMIRLRMKKRIPDMEIHFKNR
ncbi:MAG: response regulator [Deltaproteobacteria bacterium]|nr:response regulator [Deltaproteobacteria bacterium]